MDFVSTFVVLSWFEDFVELFPVLFCRSILMFHVLLSTSCLCLFSRPVPCSPALHLLISSSSSFWFVLCITLKILFFLFYLLLFSFL